MAESVKQQRERAAAIQFLAAYNARTGGTYEIKAIADAPDVLCRDANGAALNLEITFLEDRPGELEAWFKKSDGNELARFLEQMERVKRGEISVLSTISSLGSDGLGGPGTVETKLRQRLRDKVRHDYGRDAALVLYRVSPIPWDWDWVLNLRHEVEDAVQEQGLKRQPFDRGIWIVAQGEDGPTLQVVMAEHDQPSGADNA